MKQKLNVNDFIEFVHKQDECISLGNLDGGSFAIFNDWSQLERFLAAANGFEGLKGSKPYLKDGETLQSKYEEAKKLSESKTEDWYCRATANSILSHLEYTEFLAINKIDPITMDDFEGLEWGFADEFSLCSGCGREVIRISPDSYCWSAPTFIDNVGYVCTVCTKDSIDEIKEQCKNQERPLPSSLSPESLGLVKVNQDPYQHGMHSGMDDSPKPILKALNDADIDCWFVVSNSQFYQDFDVLVETKDEKEAARILKTANAYQGFSNSERLSKVLSGT